MWAAHYSSLAQHFTSPLWEAAKASNTGCRIWSLPKHFMLGSVTANWWVGILGLWQGKEHTCPYAGVYAHMHMFEYAWWPLTARWFWVRCQAPSWALHRIKSNSVSPRGSGTGLSHSAPSAPHTIPIVVLFNEEESTWRVSLVTSWALYSNDEDGRLPVST